MTPQLQHMYKPGMEFYQLTPEMEGVYRVSGPRALTVSGECETECLQGEGLKGQWCEWLEELLVPKMNSAFNLILSNTKPIIESTVSQARMGVI